MPTRQRSGPSQPLLVLRENTRGVYLKPMLPIHSLCYQYSATYGSRHCSQHKHAPSLASRVSRASRALCEPVPMMLMLSLQLFSFFYEQLLAEYDMYPDMHILPHHSKI